MKTRLLLQNNGPFCSAAYPRSRAQRSQRQGATKGAAVQSDEILHTDRKTIYSNAATQNDPLGNEKVQVKKTILCEFMGLQQTMAELD